VEKHEDYGKLFESKVLPTTQILNVQDKYLVTASRSGLMVVNIRRAFERILYEKFLRALSKGEHVSQSSLFPEQVRVGVENRLLFDEHADLLKSLGFDIVPFGTDTVVVNGVPDGSPAKEARSRPWSPTCCSSSPRAARRSPRPCSLLWLKSSPY
jgi:DNA mismatch repair protein MutL